MDKAVSICQLKKSYPTGSRFWERKESHLALLCVDLVIQKGEIFGLVGRNGYGKTTLTKCIAGLLSPSGGSVEVWGTSTHEHPALVRRLVGWVGAEERSFYLRLTARQNLMFFGRLQGLVDQEAGRRIEHFSSLLNCTALLDKRMHELSTGNRQRFSIVRGLLHDPKVLLLDEPTRSLDPFAATAMQSMLKDWVAEQPERTIVITSHQLHEIESMSDRIAIMKKRAIGAVGTLKDLRTRLSEKQRVAISLQKRAPQVALESVKTLIPELVEDSDGTRLSFCHSETDGSLSLVLQILLQHGAVIVRVDSEDISLQEMIDQLDRESS